MSSDEEKRIERAQWINWRKPLPKNINADRIYFGSETCEKLLPPRDVTINLIEQCQDRGLSTTLATPPLTNPYLQEALRLIECLERTQSSREIVCNDWGLLQETAKRRIAVPSIGRLLSVQVTDPRIKRMLSQSTNVFDGRVIWHTNGMRCKLENLPVHSLLARHYRDCWLNKDSVIQFFTSLGIHRGEISHLLHGLDFPCIEGWHYSLHVSDAPVAVFRRCPENNVDFNQPATCHPEQCSEGSVPWKVVNMPGKFFKYGNALMLCLPKEKKTSLPESVDRIVVRKHLIR